MNRLIEVKDDDVALKVAKMVEAVKMDILNRNFANCKETLTEFLTHFLVKFALSSSPGDKNILLVLNACIKMGKMGNSVLEFKLASEHFSHVLQSLQGVSYDLSDTSLQTTYLMSLEYYIGTSIHLADADDEVFDQAMQQLAATRSWQKVHNLEMDLKFNEVSWRLHSLLGVELVDAKLCLQAANVLYRGYEIYERFDEKNGRKREFVPLWTEVAKVMTQWGCALIDADSTNEGLERQDGMSKLSISMDYYMNNPTPLEEWKWKVKAIKNYMKYQLRESGCKDGKIGDYQETELKQQLLSLADAMPCTNDVMSKEFCMLGFVCFHHDLDSMCLTYMKEGVRLLRLNAKPDLDHLTRAYRIIGYAAHNTRQFELAIEGHQCCLELARKQNHDLVVAECHSNLASAYMMQYDLDNAIRHYERALEMREWLDSSDLADSEISIGNLWHIRAAQLLATDRESKEGRMALDNARVALLKSYSNYERCWAVLNFSFYHIYVNDFTAARATLHDVHCIARRNDVEAKKGIVLDQLDNPILPEELVAEIAQQRELHIPYELAAYYLEIIVLNALGEKADMLLLMADMIELERNYNYKEYVCIDMLNFNDIKALCLTLLAYSLRRVGDISRAANTFEEVLVYNSGSNTAKLALQLLAGQNVH